VRNDTARQGRQGIAAFQQGHDAPVGTLRSYGLELLGDPHVVGLDQAEGTHVILVVRIKTGRDEEHFRRVVAQGRHPDIGYDFAEHISPAASLDRHVDHIRRRVVGAAVWVERVLEDTDHQHARIVLENIFGAIAMVHVEIDDRHTLETMCLERVAGCDCDVIEEAEAHRLASLGMVARRADGTEGIFGLPRHDQIGRINAGTGRAQGSLH